MPKIQFIGRVWPQPFMVQVAPRDVHWKEGEGGSGLEAMFKIRIANSIVNVEIETNRYEPTDASLLYKQAFDLTRASVNLVAFAAGVGVVVILETFVDPNGTPTVLLPQDRSLAPLCTAFDFREPSQSRFTEIYNLVLGDATLFQSLNDLIECVWNPHVSCLNCGRVVDSIRRMTTPSGSGEAVGQSMYEALGMAQEYVEYVKNQSDRVTSGDLSFLPEDITREIVRRTWAIMNRYLEYKRGGEIPLKEPEFPLLQQ